MMSELGREIKAQKGNLWFPGNKANDLIAASSASITDVIEAFDYERSGKIEPIVAYKPGKDGTVMEVQNTVLELYKKDRHFIF